MNIFELVQSDEIASYWTVMTKDRPPYLGEELFPAKKKLGLDLKWIKGAKGLPVVLAPSAFDAQAKLRDRIGFSKLSAEMPFFKEAMMIDEALRQELNMVIETGNEVYIDSVLNRVFSDNMTLLEAAAAQRERMRMMALTTGTINITANGQELSYDYGVPAAQKVTTTKSWSDPTADIIGDINTWKELVEDAEGSGGTTPTRAVCSRKTWGYMLKNEEIKKSIYTITNGVGSISDAALKAFILDQTDVEVVVYTKRYKTETGTSTHFVPDDTFVLFPDGALGSTWFGTTPEESDLMSSKVANVNIVDTGVAVTTVEKTDPVNVEVKVTMICLPSFEAADSILIGDVIA